MAGLLHCAAVLLGAASGWLAAAAGMSCVAGAAGGGGGAAGGVARSRELLEPYERIALKKRMRWFHYVTYGLCTLSIYITSM
jgi:hypothetical protein